MRFPTSPKTTPSTSVPIPAGAAPCRLVVLVPGFHSHSKQWASLRDQLEKEVGYRDHVEAHWFPFDHETKFWTPGQVEDLARRLRNRIDQEWAEFGGFEDVVFIGHSLGGLIARRAYLLAVGAVSGQSDSSWGKSVSRIVLFASVNRGVDLDRTWWARPIAWFARALPLPHLCVEDTLMGSDFLANLRIDWIRHFSDLDIAYQAGATELGAPPQYVPQVVQFLGDNDGVVSSADSKDIEAFPNGSYQEVADATHGNLYRLDCAKDSTARYKLLRQAFVQPLPNFRSTASTDPVKRVVFLLHGIRASNTDNWVEQLEAGIKARDPGGIEVAPPTYGYFTALRFVLPSVRKKNIRFFQDQYTERLAQHPRAEFDVIAHSNGSYILGYSLDRTPGMRFKNVVLAGSPLPQNYPWGDLVHGSSVKSSQIGRVQNERANHDWVIAILCSALRAFFVRDVGTGGFAGFDGGTVFEVAYHDGDHGKALQPQNHKRLIDFVLGEPETRPTDLVDTPGLYRQLSNAAPYLAWVIFIAILAVVCWLSLRSGVFDPIPVVLSLIVFFIIWILLDVV